MKKYIILGLTLVFVLQTTWAGDVIGDTTETYSISEHLNFSEVNIIENTDTVSIQLAEASSVHRIPGHPLLPMFTKTYTVPIGSTIESISVDCKDKNTISLDKPVISASAPIIQGDDFTLYAETYDSFDTTNPYPESKYTYTVRSGIQGTEHVFFVTIRVYPVTYVASTQTLEYYTNIDVNININIPEQQQMFPDELDLLIITDESFTNALAPLVTHKNDLGVRTSIETVQDITASYDGFDDAEEVKLRIKDAIEESNIKYVLFVGGRKGGVFTQKWYVPVRYSHLDDTAEETFLADLYFADIYKVEGDSLVFDNWDSNGNGIFAEWTKWNFVPEDTMDMTPDVHLGRLACTSVSDVQIMVDKIITYETTAFGSHWFNRFVCVGGDSAPGDTYYEGEEENKQAITYMDGFEPITVWTSDETFTGSEDVINAISQGCGFLFFDGHANPGGWSTHPPNDESIWINGLQNSEMSQLENGEMLPICVVGGCHCGQFDVHPFNIIRDIVEYGIKGYFFEAPFKFYHSEWVPKCWSWKLTSVENGGSIATIAFAGLDWFAVGDDNDDGIPDCTQFFSGFINVNFFKNYGVNGITTLGETYTQTINDYIEELPPFEYYLDCKTIEELTLMGDPTLLIGGYEE